MNITLVKLSFSELSDAFTGSFNTDGNLIKSWLESPGLPYFNGIPDFPLEWPMEAFYIVAYADTGNTKISYQKEILGLISCYSDIYDSKYLIMDYISVHSDYRNLGIGKMLIDKLADNLSTDLILKRTSSSEDGLKYIQKYIDFTLTNKGIQWLQRIKDSSFEDKYRSNLDYFSV